jgi:hypothetical protein
MQAYQWQSCLNNIGEHTMSGIFKTFQSTTVQTLSSVGSAFDMLNDGIEIAAKAIRSHRDNQIENYDDKVMVLVETTRLAYKAELSKVITEARKLSEDPITGSDFDTACELLKSNREAKQALRAK